MNKENKKPYAYDLDHKDWLSWCLKNKFPSFVALQIYQWIFQHNQSDPNLFTNLSKKNREELITSFNWTLPKIDSHLISVDGCEKLLLNTPDNMLIEFVIMPYEKRVTLCLSSQVGCKRGCTFCQTGKMGFKRNLSSGEILSQLLMANQVLRAKEPALKVTNVVFMGMGEPLDNYDAVVKACTTMLDSKAFSLSARRVTVSTAGVVPKIIQLGKDLPVRLAISLHNADDEKRSSLMPINRKYPLAMLKKALINYPAPERYGITFEYVMIEGENDSLEDARKLVKFLNGINAKVNLIPINHFPGVEMQPSSTKRIEAFQSYLTDHSLTAPVRYSRGVDISGGCGQLATKRADEIHLTPQEVRRNRRKSPLAIIAG